MKIMAIGGTQLIGGFREMGYKVHALLQKKAVRHPDDIGCDFYTDPETIQVLLQQQIERFLPDIIFQGDCSGPLLHLGLEKVVLPTVWYAVDTHLHAVWHRHYAVLFDHVFCAQQNMVEQLSVYRKNVSWLPLYCSETVEWVPWDQRSFNVSFVGKVENRHNPDRQTFFDTMQRKGFDIHFASGAWAPVYRQSKMVVNQSVADDLNLRFFEAAGSGALLVTDELSHSMNDILTAGEDFLVYKHNDPDSCIRCIEWVAAHQSGAAEMAERAFRKIQSSHREIHRCEEVVKWFDVFKRREKTETSVSDKAHLACALAIASQLDLPEHLTGYFAKKSRSLVEETKKAGDKSGFSTVLVAEAYLEEQKFEEAMELLGVLTGDECDEVLLRAMKIRIVAEAGLGNRSRAAHLAMQAQRRFPDDREVGVIAAYFSGGINNP